MDLEKGGHTIGKGFSTFL